MKTAFIFSVTGWIKEPLFCMDTQSLVIPMVRNRELMKVDSRKSMPFHLPLRLCTRLVQSITQDLLSIVEKTFKQQQRPDYWE